MSARRAQAGLSVVELMVSLTIFGAVVGAAMATGTQMLRVYGTSRAMTDVGRAARVALDLVGDWTRNASPGLGSGGIVDLVGCSSGGALRVTQGDDAPDELEVIFSSGSVVTSLRAPYDAASTALAVLDASGFAAGDMAVVTSFDAAHLVAVTGVADAGGGWQLATPAPSAACTGASPAYAAGSVVVRARIARFSVRPQGGVPTLLINPDGDGPAEAEPLAEGIEDFQVAVGVNVNGDGAVRDAASTDDEWFGHAAGDAAPPAGATPRALRLSVVARTLEEEPGAALSARPAVEDRAASTIGDGFRRRTLTSAIEIRNLEGSP